VTAEAPVAAESVFEVVDGGLLTTVQDAGRHAWTQLGVPESGPADPWSLAVANLLAGNAAGAAAVEATIVGPTLRALRPVTVGLAGADLGTRVGTRRLRTGQAHRLAAGDVLEMPGGGPRGGCRAYLAIPGGFAVPDVLGSRSTCLAGGFGGLDGRPLRAGDALQTDASVPDRPGGHAWPAADAPLREDPGAAATLRVIPGPADGLDALLGSAWQVSPVSDRVGTRLDGPPLPDGIGGEVTTHGVAWGAIQVPPDGRPIVLGPDHQTTGGYRVVGVVIVADRPVLGQLAPGMEVRLEPTTAGAAVEALRAQRALLRAGEAAIRDAARWDALAHGAGG
jgi:antagonist of KipI